jgi:hypothetical protein
VLAEDCEFVSLDTQGKMMDIQCSINILSFGSNSTLIILFALLAIFGWLAITYRNIKNFEFQIFVFIVIYVIGEMLEDYKIPSSLPYLGSQLHIIAAAFLAIMLWFRLYYVRSSGRKTIDKLEPAGESDTNFFLNDIAPVHRVEEMEKGSFESQPVEQMTKDAKHH